MENRIKYILILVIILSVLSGIALKGINIIQGKIIYFQKDREIFNEIIKLYSNQKEVLAADLIIKVGEFFLEAPYVDHTLEIEPEQLVINLREFDCTTFAENCLAISKTIKSKNPGFEQFSKTLQEIRYRNGKIENYPSRIHYFSDWIYTNEQKGYIKDISREIGMKYDLNVNFMSTHPDSYKQLQNNSNFAEELAKKEKEISSRTMYFIPKEKVLDVEDKLQEGDIAGITTNIEGLDISHVVILVRKGNRIHILHASSDAGKVVISENTLEDYLLNSKTATGIMVARPL